jgi:hypothetical protein
MALTKITGQVVDTTTDLVVGVTTVGGGVSAVDGFFSGIITAVGDASFSGNVSVGGTLTYEDVTNIDAVGLVTARNGIVVGSGITLSKDGDGFFTGIVTATSFVGSGAELTGVASTENIRTNTNATFLQNVSVVGTSTHTGQITANDHINLATGKKLSMASDVFKIYHSTNAAIINESGDLLINQSVASKDLKVSTGSGPTERVKIEPTGNINIANNVNVVGVSTFNDNVNVIRINDTQVGGYRNMITNGDNLISQRYLDTSNTGYVGTVDMFRTSTPGGMSATKQRVADAPAGTGLYYSLKITNGSSTYSVPSNSNTIFHQLNSLEGYKTRMLSWGTSSARPVTLSFYVKSSQTGTFAVAIGNNTGEAYYQGTSRTFISSYTVSSANTWERKTITFEGDTSGTWVGIGTGGSLSVIWDLGSGGSYQGASTGSWQSSSNFRFSGAKSLGDTASATWQITGIQLEIGRQATDFEHKDYDDVLNECRRHFQTWYWGDMNGSNSHVDNFTGGTDNNAATLIATGFCHDPDDIHVSAEFCPNMRSRTPAVVDFTDMRCISGGTVYDNVTYVQGNYSSRDRMNLHIDNEGSMTGGYGAALILKNSGSKLSISCEI